MSSYRVLLVHNAYQYRGGEDSVVEAETALLRDHGHTVETYLRHNDDIVDISAHRVAAQTLWSSKTYQDIRSLVDHFRPDLIHAHNVYPLISPSLYWAAQAARVPVVQTLHNFRLMCLNALYMRNGMVCEDCTGRLPWRGVLRRCYRGSVLASGALAATLTLHRGMGSYRHRVARYIALNEFCRSKFIEGGLPASKVVVKPNFVDFPAPEEGCRRQGLLYVGRLSQEKGVTVLAQAAREMPISALRVVGEGPDAGVLDAVAVILQLGALSAGDVRAEMSRAVALVVPSIWYENFPRIIVEAFAAGLPVIASRIGALAELVRDGVTGLLVEPGNASDLATKMSWASANPELMAQMGRNARAQYEAEFSADVNHRKLISIYQEVLKEAESARMK